MPDLHHHMAQGGSPGSWQGPGRRCYLEESPGCWRRATLGECWDALWKAWMDGGECRYFVAEEDVEVTT